ncbi:FGFR1 oncogene partner 2 homolog [Oppia nitens]|uniref:FGFR1 oncogene partner 2 homolog n=1 Tax=Oppia nitens TaxID=1686743 RepID=UPI0023DB1F8B|nr:FGFR1 oncogene partner 2 homolog [Oppia nitens]
MAVSMNQLLSDAKKLVTKLKEYDHKTDHLMSKSQTLNNAVENMKQYHEEVLQMSSQSTSSQRNSIIVTIQRESKQLRKLETENRELKLALEDYQWVLELIMSKYRQHTNQLIKLEKVETQCLNNQTNNSNEVITRLMNQICEMASVMNESILMDDKNSLKEQELIAKLKTENKALRELLQIARANGSLNKISNEMS